METDTVGCAIIWVALSWDPVGFTFLLLYLKPSRFKLGGVRGCVFIEPMGAWINST